VDTVRIGWRHFHYHTYVKLLLPIPYSYPLKLDLSISYPYPLKYSYQFPIFFILFTKKIIIRDNYIENNISYFFNNLPYRANGYEMIFTHTLTHLLNEIIFLSLSISNKLTKKKIIHIHLIEYGTNRINK
jgi:hypothetical protein